MAKMAKVSEKTKADREFEAWFGRHADAWFNRGSRSSIRYYAMLKAYQTNKPIEYADRAVERTLLARRGFSEGVADFVGKMGRGR